MRAWEWRHSLWLLALVGMLPVAAAPQVGDEVRFIACPVYRNTDVGRKSGCWLGDDTASGIRYDIGQGITKPQVGREVLVEGVVTAEPDVCGGVVLLPMRASTLPSHCPATLIPAESFPGRRYVAPPAQMAQTWVPRELPPGPYPEREFRILFDFGSDFLNYQYSEVILERISLYVKASRARRVRVTGYAAVEPLSVSGQALREPLTLAAARAQMVAEALRRLEVPADRITVTSATAPLAAAGVMAGTEVRRVVIRVEP